LSVRAWPASAIRNRSSLFNEASERAGGIVLIRVTDDFFRPSEQLGKVLPVVGHEHCAHARCLEQAHAVRESLGRLDLRVEA